MLTEEDIIFFKNLLEKGTQVNGSIQSLDDVFFEIANKYQIHDLFDEYYNIKNFFFEGQDANNLDLNLIVQQYTIFKQTQSENFLEKMDVVCKSLCLTFTGLIRYFAMSNCKELIIIEFAQFLIKSLTDSEIYLGLVLLSEYYNFDVTEGNNAKFLFDLSCEMKQILIEVLNNPNDIEKHSSKIESLSNQIPDSMKNGAWMDKTTEWFFMNDLSFKDIFAIHFHSFEAALKRGLEEGFEFLFKFCQDNMEMIKTAKQQLPKTENNYNYLETFEAKVEEYGEQVKQIEHKTKLCTKLVGENSKSNMMASINDDVDNFRMKKRNLNTEINSTLRDLMKTKALLINHLFRILTVMALSYANIFLGFCLNTLAKMQKKNQIDNKIAMNLIERSCEVLDYIVEDFDGTIKQKRKVLDKIEQLDTIKADFKGWHQTEKDCFEKLSQIL